MRPSFWCLWLSLLALCASAVIGCDTDEDPVDAITDATPPDAAVEDPRAGAPCPDGRCAEGICLDGICSPPCDGAFDCAAPLICAARGAGQFCTPPCLNRDDCPEGTVCITQGVASGLCLAPGPGGGNAACNTGADCESWICAGGRCAAPCEGDCPEGEICLPLHTQAVCAPAGQGADEARCEVAADCLSGVCRGGTCSTTCPADRDCPHDRSCVDWPRLALCERRCTRTEECGPNGYCEATVNGALCQTRGDGEDGTGCTENSQCASAHCLGGVCAAMCERDDQCPNGRCVADLAGAACRPAGALDDGANCARSSECASAFCAAGVCSQACFDGPEACGEGTRCVAFSDGRFCFPTCRLDATCPSGAVCTDSFVEGRICFRRGAALAGAGCTEDLDCRSGRCASGRCLANCALGVCPGGGRCTDFPNGAFCAESPRPEGAECTVSRDCEDPLTCIGGRCLPFCNEAGECAPGRVCRAQLCYLDCATDLDCPAGRRCNPFDTDTGICQDIGERPNGADCAASGECESGLCFEARCRPRCDQAACPEAETCLPFGTGAWCVPAGPQTTGALCEAHADCESGLCVGRRCARPCAEGCAEGQSCVALRSGPFCLSSCAPEAGACGENETCAPVLEERGLCTLLEGSPIGGECTTLDDCTPLASACIEGRCGARCEANADCDDGEICAATQGVTVCVTQGRQSTLAPCERGADCKSGVCSGGRCHRECSQCDVTERCVDLSRRSGPEELRCAAACTVEADCAAGLSCRLDALGHGACY